MTDLPPPTERGVSPIARTPRVSPRNRKLLVGGGILGVMVLSGLGINAVIKDKGIPAKPVDTGSQVIAQVTQTPPEPRIEQAAAVIPHAALPAILQPPPAPVVPAVIAAAPENFVRLPATWGTVTFMQPPPTAANDEKAAATPPGPQAAPQTDVAFKAETIAGGRAGRALNMAYVMRPGLIPCALDTAMNSTLAGALLCHTTADVYSDAHVLLMPQHTGIVGQYKNDLRIGQTRVYALAANALTPEGIPVPLNSGIGDGLGRAGITGEVDNHLLERFGAAVALTGVQSATNVLQAMMSKGGNTYLNLNSGNGAETIAAEILRNQIGIPPTIDVAPGTVVQIVVDHPISFEDALSVRPRERP